MKKKLLGAIGLIVLGSASPASAADLPQRPVPAPVPTWWCRTCTIRPDSTSAAMPVMAGAIIAGVTLSTTTGPEGCSTQAGALLGGQGGYRWQFGQFVFGVEAQGDWTSMRGSIPSLFLAGGTNSAKVTSVGLFTGQVGYAMNNALLYVKGGAAVTNNNFLVSNGASQFQLSSDRWGASVGVGLDYGITNNWIVGLEYDHLFMGNANNSFSCSAGCAAALNNNISQGVDMITVRVNYKFGGPVVARY